MTDINFYGLCRALYLSPEGYENGLRELARYLRDAPGLKGLPAAENCLMLMSKIDNGYGFRRESVYIPGTLLILNSEAILIRLLNLQRSVYPGAFANWNPRQTIDITRFNRILYCAQSGGTVFSAAPSYLGTQGLQVRLNGMYAAILMYISCYEFFFTNPQAFLNNLRSCGAAPQEIRDIEILAQAMKATGTVPTDFTPGMEGFARTLFAVSAIFKKRSPIEITTEMIEYFCKARNNVAHRGKMLKNPAYARNVIRTAMIFFRCAIIPPAASPKPFKDRLKYNLMNPLDFLNRPIGDLALWACIVMAALILLWTFTPTPMSERMYFKNVRYGGEKEKLYDAFARKDTAKAIEIHRDVNTIIEAEEKAGK